MTLITIKIGKIGQHGKRLDSREESCTSDPRALTVAAVIPIVTQRFIVTLLRDDRK